MDELNKDLTKTYNGVCQACFADHAVKNSAKGEWLIVLHGYRRPGTGETLGRCIGARVTPYELSCELTKAILVNTRNKLAGRQDYLERLLADKVDEFYIEKSEYDRATGRRVQRLIKIGRDYVGDCRSYDFKYYLKGEIDHTRTEILCLKNDEALYLEKIAAWKFDPGALIRKPWVQKPPTPPEKKRRRRFGMRM